MTTQTTDERDPDPDSDWEFDETVAECFSDMLRRSIPQYETMRQLVTDLGHHYIQPQSYVVDLGSSRGSAVGPFVDEYGDSNRFRLVEVSDPMLDQLRDRYSEEIDAGTVEVDEMDLRWDYPYVESSLTLSILTLQFIPRGVPFKNPP